MQVKSRCHKVICLFSYLYFITLSLPCFQNTSPVPVLPSPAQIIQIPFPLLVSLCSGSFLLLIQSQLLSSIPVSLSYQIMLIFLPFCHATCDTDLMCYIFNSKLPSAGTITCFPSSFPPTSPQYSALMLHDIIRVNDAK